MGKRSPKYIAETREEFDELVKSTKLLNEHYSLILDDTAILNVKKGAFEKSIWIFPESGKINSIEWMAQNSKGILRRSSPKEAVIQIEEYTFIVDYINPNEKTPEKTPQ